MSGPNNQGNNDRRAAARSLLSWQMEAGADEAVGNSPVNRLAPVEKQGDRKICARMAQLGFLPGSEIELICPGGSSQCMVRVKGSTVTLDQFCADNILVTPCS